MTGINDQIRLIFVFSADHLSSRWGLNVVLRIVVLSLLFIALTANVDRSSISTSCSTSLIFTSEVISLILPIRSTPMHKKLHFRRISRLEYLLGLAGFNRFCCGIGRSRPVKSRRGAIFISGLRSRLHHGRLSGR